jgi:hypothetical protein
VPCSDQTEQLTLELDSQDRIRSFSLDKRTCHQPVGGAALLPVIRDMPARSLLEADADGLIDPRVDDVQAFMLTKQLFALQGAIEVMYGLPENGHPQAFELHELEYDSGGTRLAGEIAINIIAEQISSCGGCRCSL